MQPTIPIECEDDFIEIPKLDIVEEFEISEKFCYAQENHEEREVFIHAISGMKPFKKFKNTLDGLQKHNEWYTFKKGEIEGVAKKWCEGHSIQYEEVR